MIDEFWLPYTAGNTQTVPCSEEKNKTIRDPPASDERTNREFRGMKVFFFFFHLGGCGFIRAAHGSCPAGGSEREGAGI